MCYCYNSHIASFSYLLTYLSNLSVLGCGASIEYQAVFLSNVTNRPSSTNWARLHSMLRQDLIIQYKDILFVVKVSTTYV